MVESKHGGLTRRETLASLGRALGAQGRLAPTTPLDELVNSLEFGEEAKRVLPDDVFASIPGSDRSIFDRYTFRPRMNVSTLDMDLSVELFGQRLFTPIVVGPVSDQMRYHPEGERATMHGASAAQTVTVVSDRASISMTEIGAIASEVAMPFWAAVYAGADGPERARSAVAAGAKVVFVTVKASYDGPSGKSVPARAADEIDWSLVDAIRDTVDVPVVIKGVTSPEDARLAAERGLDGLVVSNFGGLLGGSKTAPIPELLQIADAVGGELPILVDGSFRRATDVLVALILGARAVLLGRPIVWALAAYGAEGVRTLIQMLQSDVARCFAMLGASNVSALTRRHLRIHTR